MKWPISSVKFGCFFSFVAFFLLSCHLFSTQGEISSKKVILPKNTVSQSVSANKKKDKHPIVPQKKDDSDKPELEGCCPVCFFDMGVFIEGEEKYRTEYKNKIYLFSGQKQKDLFLKNPQRYVSAEVRVLFMKELEAQLRRLNG